MLGKLLKYDLKSMLKYWWITAISSLVLSAAGGASLAYIINSEDYPSALIFPMVLLVFLAFLGMFGFIVLSTIFIFTRFYKNFFTDEGYLTFTLPVSRFALLNSKLISSVLVTTLTVFVFFVELIVFIIIPVASTNAWHSALPELSSLLSELNLTVGPYIYVFVVEALIAVLLSNVYSTLLFFFCITFAAMISKKAKVIIAIGIYYLANSITSTFSQLLFSTGLENIADRVMLLSDASAFPVVALIVLGILLFMAIVCLALYALEYWMLDRKLNLN